MPFTCTCLPQLNSSWKCNLKFWLHTWQSGWLTSNLIITGSTGGPRKTLCTPTTEIEWWQFNGLQAQNTTPLPLYMKDPPSTLDTWRQVPEPALQKLSGIVNLQGSEIPFKRWLYCAWLQMEILQPSITVKAPNANIYFSFIYANQ